MVLARPPQPLVFCFSGPYALYFGLREAARISSPATAALCFYEGRYYLQLQSPLRSRPRFRRAIGEFGQCLGAAPVFFAHAAEHGVALGKGRLLFGTKP